MSSLHDIAKQLVAPGKGILAADESNSTAGKRLASIHMESSEDNRRQYRELFLGAEGIENHLSGVILYDETFHQSMEDGTLFVKQLENKGILPGIKVDMGLQDLPNFPEEQITAGLDGLEERLAAYYQDGARFAKWRGVITIGDNLPTNTCVEANAHVFARYAGLCQAAGIVPIVEPEVLLAGNHTLEKSEEVTTYVLQVLFDTLKDYRIELEGLILKSSMAISGSECDQQATPEQVGEATVRMLKSTVPSEVPGVVFLSGGQTAEQATENLNAINVAAGDAPWQLTFSYARALQGPSLTLWNGDRSNWEAAREKFLERLRANSEARAGKYQS